MLRGELKVEREQIQQFGSDLPDIAALITNAISEEYAGFVRENYLSGQVLNVITGETRDSVKFFQRRKTASLVEYGVRPGVGIQGSLNYLAGMARRGYAFMQPSVQTFAAANQPENIAERVMNGIIRRGGYSK